MQKEPHFDKRSINKTNIIQFAKPSSEGPLSFVQQSPRESVSPCTAHTTEALFNVFLRLIAHERGLCVYAVGIDVKK